MLLGTCSLAVHTRSAEESTIQQNPIERVGRIVRSWLEQHASRHHKPHCVFLEHYLRAA